MQRIEYANGKKQIRNFKFTLITNQGNKSRQLIAEVIQKQLKDIGIEVEILILEWSIFINNYITPRNFDAVILGWSLSRDPDQFSIWHSSQKNPGQYNFVSYENPEVDKLLELGRKEFNFEKRKKYIKEFIKLFMMMCLMSFYTIQKQCLLFIKDLKM